MQDVGCRDIPYPTSDVPLEVARRDSRLKSDAGSLSPRDRPYLSRHHPGAAHRRAAVRKPAAKPGPWLSLGMDEDLLDLGRVVPGPPHVHRRGIQDPEW